MKGVLSCACVLCVLQGPCASIPEPCFMLQINEAPPKESLLKRFDTTARKVLGQYDFYEQLG